MSELNLHTTDTSLGLGGQGSAADYFALLKPRVMSLVVFTAVAGLLAAPGQIHPWLGFVTILCIAVGAGASGALNMWFDADIDAVMKRTSTRPIPSGAIQPGEALGFGLALAIGSVVVLGLLVNLASAALLAFTIFFYIAIYTMWLKRATPQNIVIGGAAGAFPPMVAWAAVTGGVDLGSIALFLLIFVWTPPHFWALALYRESDYAEAGVPMMPNVAGRDETKRQIWIYSLLTVPAVALPMLTGTVGLLYVAGAVPLTAIFLIDAFKVYRAPNRPNENRAAKKLFTFSILWLFALFALVVAEKLAHIPAVAQVF
jgi:protoheme IX farnesyltransferase